MAYTVAIIDDDPALRDLVVLDLEARGHRTRSASSAREALDWIEAEQPIDAIVTDVTMGEMDGVELCQRVHAIRPKLPVVLMTAYATVASAVAALRVGAFDFVTKPFDADHLGTVMERALATTALDNELGRVRQRMTVPESDEITGDSRAIVELRALIERVADSQTTVLITGESGTGKELVARAIHRRSARREGPFVAINCAAMPENLLESELFGHARGAFTDAKAARSGLFVRANGGTLLLDEIGEMSLPMQAKLLRVLQERTLRPVGSDFETSFDVRVLAATNRDLAAEVQAGRFREDLLYRVNVVNVPVPALRQRGSDVLLLAQRFLADATSRLPRTLVGFSISVAHRLLAYDWPGNVRQLENCIERAVAVSLGDELVLEDLPAEILEPTHQELDARKSTGDMITMDELELRYIHKLLVALDGNKTAVAQVLGFDRRTLYRKLASGKQ